MGSEINDAGLAEASKRQQLREIAVAGENNRVMFDGPLQQFCIWRVAFSHLPPMIRFNVRRLQKRNPEGGQVGVDQDH